MENIKKTTELCNQIEKNTKLIGDVTASFKDEPMDVLTAVNLNVLYAENQLLLMECNQIFREELIRLNKKIIQLDS